MRQQHQQQTLHWCKWCKSAPQNSDGRDPLLPVSRLCLCGCGHRLRAQQETAAFGSDQSLRNTAIIPTWAANGIRPAIPVAVAAQEPDW
eukprot:COSAG06_NODE_14_length_35011_cov_20.984132_13_plen_89_part_00